jgi:hypothetical protein
MLYAQLSAARIWHGWHADEVNRLRFFCGNKERALPNNNKRRMIIRQKRKARAKRKKEEGYIRVVERRNGRKKVRFVKPSEAAA